MMVSSMSTIARWLDSSSTAISGAWAPSRTKNREATASSWRTWPKVKDRRNDPRVEGA
jgi:hypothetical protein